MIKTLIPINLEILWDFIKIAFYIAQILLWYTKGLLLNLKPDISMISLLYHEKGYPLMYTSTMSMQYPNPISETWYCSDIYFYIAKILLWYTNGSLLYLMPDISVISLLYHEKDISLPISELFQRNIQILYPKLDIAAI